MKNTKTFKKHVKAIFRTEAFLLIGILSIITGFYIYFFLEFHVKRAVEKSAFEALGSEVNINDLDINFLEPSVHIYRVQITDPDKPIQNIIEISKITSKFKYGPLFQSSFISDLTEVKGIKVHTKRSRRGKVLSREQRVVVFKDPSQSRIQNVLKDKFKATTFSDIVNLFRGDKSKSVEDKYKNNLESVKVSKALESKMMSISKDLQKLERQIESPKVKSLLNEVKSFRFDSSSTNASLKSVSKALILTKKLKQEKKAIKKEITLIQKKSKDLKRQLENSPAKFLEDLAEVGSSLSIKNLTADKISESVLSEYFSLQLNQVGRAANSLKKDALGNQSKYVDLAVGSDKKANQGSPKGEKINQFKLEQQKEKAYLDRAQDFIFYQGAVSPQYWFKRIEISSKASSGQDLGDIEGLIQDVTDAPQITGKKMLMNIKGSVPKQNVGFFSVDASVDHRRPNAKQEKINIDVSDYLVKGVDLFRGSDELIRVLKSNAKTTLDINLTDGEISLELNQLLLTPEYEISAEDKYVQILLEEIKKHEGPLSFRLKATGEVSSPKLNVRSNLGEIILNAVRSSLSKIAKNFTSKKLSKINEAAGEKLKPYIKDLDILSLKTEDLNKILSAEIESGLKKLKSKNKGSEKDLLKKLFRKF